MKKSKIQEDLPHLQDKKSYRKRENVHGTTSQRKGMAGIFEVFFRTFRHLSALLVILPIGLVYFIAVGLSISPALYIFSKVVIYADTLNTFLKILCLSTTAGIAYFVFGITLIFVVPLFNCISLPFIKPWRGPAYSLPTLPWYYHNALVQLVRYTFLNLVTPTPINVLFYRLMGMKVGKGVVINTSNISDPCMITIEDNVTIGGSATIFAHYAQGGYLVMAPVLIKKGATVGLKASIMGDVIIGEKVTVPPHSVQLPKTRLNKGDPK
jgi:hypothetical protein